MLDKLSNAVGISGYEEEIAELIKSEMEKYTDSVEIDTLGNVIGLKKGNGKGKIMLAAHMDEIGLVITHIGKFLHFVSMGGIDPRVLLGQEVIVVTEKGKYDGVIGAKPPHIQKPEERKKAIEIDDLVIDLGFPEEKIKEIVKKGDFAVVNVKFTELANDHVTGKALDNRICVYTVLETMKLLEETFCDIYFVATTQEEVGARGARVSGYKIFPDIGIAIDATFGLSKDSKEDTFKLGKGPCIGLGPNISPKVFELLKKTAKKEKIPYQIEVLPGMSGTDAVSLQTVKSGTATGVVSIPLRYMHTPVETADLKDVRNCAKLLKAFISSIDEKILEGLKCF
ncbi:MAG: M42 family metallopeptidase [Methanomicrobia archaeon]|nr:M42 family metallopeptidase [Methanomicrobia archaeon]RLF93223.1 MAG: M42 family peptidase [Thermococci archaeon]HEC95678.1 M42 family peptidase [Euryarchaeota archaeon]